MMDPAVESIVRNLEPMPKFPINIIPDKDGSCNKKRLYTEKNLEATNINGIELVKCSPEGVDLLVPDERKDLIPAIKWAITIPRFWFSVIFKVAGLPLSKDRMVYLENVAKGSPVFPLLILEERRSHPEFLPCGELDLETLKSMLMVCMPSNSIPAYPKQPKRLFTPREMNLLQSAIKHDLFFVMLCNPILWLPLKHEQVDSLIEEFFTAGSRLHRILAEAERGDSFVETAADNGEMPDLPKDVLIEIQLAERKRILSGLDDFLFNAENVVETEAPAGGIASRFHIDEKKRKIREEATSKREFSQNGSARGIESYRAYRRGEAYGEENPQKKKGAPKKKVTGQNESSKGDQAKGKSYKEKAVKRKIILKENKLSETKSLPKKEKLITGTPSVPIACGSPEPDKVKFKWSSSWNKLHLFVKKNDASKTETRLKDRFFKMWKRDKKPESTVRPLNEIHSEADEPSVSTIRVQTTRVDKPSAQSSPMDFDGFVELPPSLDPTGGLSKRVPKATPFEKLTSNIRNRVSNFKRKREELRKVSTLEKISMGGNGLRQQETQVLLPS